MSETAPRPRKRRKEHHGNHERWVISYADFITLLLAFFVVLYASSVQDKHKMDEEAQSFLKAFHAPPGMIKQESSGDRGVMNHQPSPVPKPVESPASADTPVQKQMIHQLAQDMLQLQDARAKLEKMLQPMIGAHQVGMQSDPLTLTIQLNDSVLFSSGQAVLTPAAQTLLKQIAASLTSLPPKFHIFVGGYTDNQPIATAQFSSNWALSAARAVSVVELFQKAGISGGQLAAQGFGEFSPLASNDSAAGREQNRRVVLVIHAPDPGSLAAANH
ncbi:MAG TPA: flagellar motor protein MotB [Acidocella sp.]|nr:flagellar motor protein MotB [Acidocella sp.]